METETRLDKAGLRTLWGLIVSYINSRSGQSKDIEHYSGEKTTNANGNISTGLDATTHIIIGATFMRDSGSTAICTVYTNAGTLGIHVTDNSGTASDSATGTLRYSYIEI